MKMNTVFVKTPSGELLKNIISLWQKVFGDDESFVCRLVSSESYVGAFCTEYGGELLGMAHIISLESSRKAYYCYAVATTPACRGRGICRHIMKHAAAMCEAENAALLLHPASEGLADYYRVCGFVSLSYSYSVGCEGDGGAFSRVSAAEYKRIRDHQLGGMGYYGWNEDMLGLSGLEFISFDIDGEYMAAAFRDGEIVELCAPPHLLGRAAKRAASVGGKCTVVMLENSPLDAQTSVMGYNCPEFSYFNLFLD